MLERLYCGYSFHRRGEERPGELPYTPYRVPVYSNTGGNVAARYVRTYVELSGGSRGDRWRYDVWIATVAGGQRP